ncbi:MAG TPA: trigger factor [Fimbriimonadaceae bacterium]|nr:trigger factor [Fimbriimonadaceae bacterium]HRJ32824.1 trigger factor [Fimbriimonadaceae bacterium]
MTNIAQVTREDLNPCTVKLSIACTSDQVEAGFDRALKQFGKRVRVPGFRPGHAPKAMIERFVPESDLKNAAAEEIVRNVLQKALTDEKLVPHESPGVELKALERAEGKCEFDAIVPLAPIVELGEYKGLTATMPFVDVTDEELDERIEALRKRKSKREAITGRGAQEGDIAVINIRSKDEEGDGKTFMVVVGKTFKDLDAALTGMSAEEMKHIDLKFPKEFQEESLAGKKADCTITVRSLNSVIIPELDDAFAQDMKADNLDDFKAKLKARLMEAKKDNAQENLNEQLQDQIVASSTIHVPDTMWQNVAMQRLNDLAREVHEAGMKMEDYAQERGMEIAELVKSYEAEAKTQVLRAVAITEIFKREAMKLTNQDMSDELMGMAREFNIHPEELLKELRRTNNLRELEYRAIFKKVVGYLNNEAKIEYAQA